MSDMVCLCLCHVGIRPTKGEVKAFLTGGVGLADPVAAATACSVCTQRHAESIGPANHCNGTPTEPVDLNGLRAERRDDAAGSSDEAECA